jgi:hypothetical protein
MPGGMLQQDKETKPRKGNNMNSIDAIFNLAGSIVVLAGVTVVITSKQTQGIINSLAGALSSNIKAATQQ